MPDVSAASIFRSRGIALRYARRDVGDEASFVGIDPAEAGRGGVGSAGPGVVTHALDTPAPRASVPIVRIARPLGGAGVGQRAVTQGIQPGEQW
jgi:hypothetical protein